MASEFVILAAYRKLARAIVLQAMKDYTKIFQMVLRGKISPESSEVLELRRFFRSEWFRMLFDYDGNWLMNILEEECKNKRLHQNKIFDSCDFL